MLPELLDCSEYVNSDEFAKHLSPFAPESAYITASRLMLRKVNYLFDKKKISRSKFNRLLVSHKAYISRKAQGKETEEDKELWENFIDRLSAIHTSVLAFFPHLHLHDAVTSGCETVFFYALGIGFIELFILVVAPECFVALVLALLQLSG